MGIAPRAERRGPLPSWRRAGVGSSPIRASPADRRGRPPGGLGRRGNSDEPRSGRIEGAPLGQRVPPSSGGVGESREVLASWCAVAARAPARA